MEIDEFDFFGSDCVKPEDVLRELLNIETEHPQHDPVIALRPSQIDGGGVDVIAYYADRPDIYNVLFSFGNDGSAYNRRSHMDLFETDEQGYLVIRTV